MLMEGISSKALIDFSHTVSERKMGDCRTQAFCTILNHFGYKISPQEIFGLGYGLDFQKKMVNYNGFDLLSISGRNFEAESNCCKLLGLECLEKKLQYKPETETLEYPFEIEILEEVARGYPVLLECDIFYMTYVKNIKKVHNQYHMVIVIGYDLDNKELTVIDSITNKKHKIAMIQMYKAMFTKQFQEEAIGTWYVIYGHDGQHKRKNISIEKYQKSMVNHAKHMLSNQGPLMVMLEVRDFLTNITSRAEQGSSNHENYLKFIIDMNCISIRRQDELNGTCFRSLYTKYIEDVLDKVKIKEDEQNKIIALLKKSEELWKEITFKVRYFQGNVLEKSSLFVSAVDRIYQTEKEIAVALLKLKEES